MKSYNVICSLVLRRGFLIRCAILVLNIYVHYIVLVKPQLQSSHLNYTIPLVNPLFLRNHLRYFSRFDIILLYFYNCRHTHVPCYRGSLFFFNTIYLSRSIKITDNITRNHLYSHATRILDTPLVPHSKINWIVMPFHTDSRKKQKLFASRRESNYEKLAPTYSEEFITEKKLFFFLRGKFYVNLT